MCAEELQKCVPFIELLVKNTIVVALQTIELSLNSF